MDSLDLDMEILTQQVKKIFGALETKNFEIQKVSRKNTDAIGDYAEILIKNKKLKKCLVIMYVPAGKHPEGLSIFLENNKNDTFSISEFLIYKKIDAQLLKLIKLTNYTGTLEKRLKETLIANKEIIFQYLSKFLFNDEWETIPIQWGDMK